MMFHQGALADWWPVTHDFGLVCAPLERAADTLFELFQPHMRMNPLRPIEADLGTVFEHLLPLQMPYARRLFVETRFGWTAYFTNGGSGSDPFPAMSLLARTLDTDAMRICSTPAVMRYQATIWEVYGGRSRTDDPGGHVRSIAAANDGGRWAYHTSGEPYSFECQSAFSAKLIRNRFTSAMLSGYLAEFNIPELCDSAFASAGKTRAILISSPDFGHAVKSTLQEAKSRLTG